MESFYYTDFSLKSLYHNSSGSEFRSIQSTITQSVDVRNVSLILFISDNLVSGGVNLDANIFQAESTSIGSSTNSIENVVIISFSDRSISIVGDSDLQLSIFELFDLLDGVLVENGDTDLFHILADSFSYALIEASQ